MEKILLGCPYLQGLTTAWLVGRSVHEHMVHICDAVGCLAPSCGTWDISCGHMAL